MKNEDFPHSLEIEKSFLCCVLNPEVCDLCMGLGVESSYFYDLRNKVIWETAFRQYGEHGVVDYTLLFQELRKNPDARGVDLVYLQEVADFTSLTNYREYAQELKYFVDARMSWEYTMTMQMTLRKGGKIEEIASAAGELTNEFTAELARDEDGGLGDACDEFAGELDDCRQGVPMVTGTPTQFKYLDKIIAGLHRGETVVIGARPSTGKTAFGLNLCENLGVIQEEETLFFSMETKKNRIVERLASSMARVNIHKLRTGFPEVEDFQRLAGVLPFIKDSKIKVVFKPRPTTTEFENIVRMFVRRHGVKVVVVDYLQLMRSSKKNRSQEEDIADVSNSLTEIAKKLDIVLVVLAQLNREYEKDKKRLPRPSDIRGSGQVEQDADTILLLHEVKVEEEEERASGRSWSDERQKMMVVVGKNRNGPKGVANFMFYKSCMRFEECRADDMPSGVEVSHSQYLDFGKENFVPPSKRPVNLV